MTIIFAVAFLLVLISLVLQAHTAKAALSDLKESNSSALSNAAVNAELLQDENRKLQEELDSTKKLLADEQEKAKRRRKASRSWSRSWRLCAPSTRRPLKAVKARRRRMMRC